MIKKLNTRLVAIIFALVLLLTSLTTTAAFAEEPVGNQSSGSGYTYQWVLEFLGYDCGRAGAGFVVCTRGKDKYYCSGGKCVKVRTTSKPVYQPAAPTYNYYYAP